ncbi:cytochrome P450 monooxygenase 51 [Heterobasidion irregulare TC 32-1]|uniref:Cytochrome P450 monooxygenase 51 n=1 Tax=Heterobasidion irregulare (strain TC 32-1) TaxID=747525 RepID=W4K5C7_HETIT|nr:cytochrome P450 monooxygenase 51 [Heterobasidion irregulare TC 32-1]ETW81028.1 cytochrome P450 monooxygenase 51 [Heterobasidion irregulare TC 32-1]
MVLGGLTLTECVFALTSALLGVRWYLKRGSNLDSIPTVGFSGPILSYITAVQYLFKGNELVQEGYDKYKGGLFKIAMLDHWEVIASGSQTIEDVRKASDSVLSFMDAVARTLQVEYTLGPEIHHNPYHVSIIRSQLTRNLGALFPDVREEIVASFNDIIPAKDEWVKYPAMETLMKIVCRTSNRIFVGAPQCRDPDYNQLNVKFTIDVVKAALVINRFPDVLKPLAGRLFTSVPGSIRRAIRHLAPIIEDRRAKLRDLGDDWNDKPNDMLMWLMEEARGDEQSTRNLALRILTVNFAAIHTSSMSFTHALYPLAANPEYARILREEVESVVATDGWTKLAMGKMHKVDSFLRESQRFDGLGVLTMQRHALKPFTFSNGQMVPTGTLLSCTSMSVHHDAENYTNADVFDPWRFSDMREGEGEAAKHQMVSTTPEFLAFGHGKHACPGRFFAANELKAMLAHVVITYDVRFEDGGAPPPNLYVGSACVPGKGHVLFRKRQV